MRIADTIEHNEKQKNDPDTATKLTSHVLAGRVTRWLIKANLQATICGQISARNCYITTKLSVINADGVDLGLNRMGRIDLICTWPGIVHGIAGQAAGDGDNDRIR